MPPRARSRRSTRSREGRAHRGPFHYRQPFLGLQLERGLDSDRPQLLRPRQDNPVTPADAGVGVACEGPDDVGERDEVAGGDDGAPQGERGRVARVLEAPHGVQDLHRHPGDLRRQLVSVPGVDLGVEESDELTLELRAAVGAALGRGAKPDGDVVRVRALPCGARPPRPRWPPRPPVSPSRPAAS
ncbi:hypothetical protein H6P81_002629 [Aristolochia fimbriata]|uniref:Uncharacterized protein n=1 Tax=Aristolochia fimbriata TaxID=158543 RepID=A0AAV7FBG6_ARIFI|nr:hypothetical protein H6P81_002629 [Aristolochia fimbriata]